MAAHPTVGIDNYLPSGQPGVALRSANHKTSCWIDQIPRLRVDPLGRDHSFYDSLNQSFPDLLVLYVGSHEVHIYDPGPGHTRGDLVVYFPDQHAIATGDLFLGPYQALVAALPSKHPAEILGNA